MQCGDGGWGWFSGNGEYVFAAHDGAMWFTACKLPSNNESRSCANGMLERGVKWLKNAPDSGTGQSAEKRAEAKTQPYKETADNLDAFVYMVLVDASVRDNAEMRDFLYRDRNNLAVYSKAMFGLALQKKKQQEKLAMIMQNIDQYLVQDNENQTAYLKLPENNYWWNWYGSEYEADSVLLKLLAAVDPKDEKASRLVKYLHEQPPPRNLLEQHSRHRACVSRRWRNTSDGQRRRRSRTCRSMSCSTAKVAKSGDQRVEPVLVRQ